MLTFPDPRVTKELLVADMIAHAEADELVRGTYGESDPNFRGCSVGCSIHTINRVMGARFEYNSHAALADATGIPIALIHLQDRVFEGMCAELSKNWPRRFYEAVPKNIDLLPAVNRILVRILSEVALPVVTVDNLEVKEFVKGVCKALKNGKRFNAAPNAAAYATGRADHAAANAYTTASARAAADAYVGAAAHAAADADADSDGIAWVAYYAATAAAYAAPNTYARAAARSAARAAAYKKIAKIICKEMAKCV
jgi:hypothetical protein